MRIYKDTWMRNVDAKPLRDIIEKETDETVTAISAVSFQSRPCYKVNFDGVPKANKIIGDGASYIYFGDFGTFILTKANFLKDISNSFYQMHTFGKSFFKEYIKLINNSNEGKKINGKTYVEDFSKVPEMIEFEKKGFSQLVKNKEMEDKIKAKKEVKAMELCQKSAKERLEEKYRAIELRSASKIKIRESKYDELKAWANEILYELENEKGLER